MTTTDAHTLPDGCSRTQLHIHADLRELGRAREALQRAAQPVLGARTHMMILAVDEALSNVIRHGEHEAVAPAADGLYADADNIEFEIAVTPQSVEVQITDPFAAFDPGVVADVQLPERVRSRLRGGMGVGIMRLLLDKIEYARVDGRYNRLKLIKRREQLV
jgi:anti-sigma regulatory factor (Ser/Thr protein kinase)